jgi:hypothetical protein
MSEYNGSTLKGIFKEAERCIRRHVRELNRLNIFPVPDGDTGNNMLATIRAANKEIGGLDTTSAAVVSNHASRGALFGARGNSGVILSQILKGVAKTMEMKEKFSGQDFARSLKLASETAYQTIACPIEGTILTVAREVGDHTIWIAEKGGDLREIVKEAVSKAKETVERTPKLLPQLDKAGVVDAGGKGYFYFLCGARDFICGVRSGMKRANPEQI